MSPWRVDLTPAAGRRLRRLRPEELLALRGVIMDLANERHPPGASKLVGTDLWRIRVRVDGVPWRVVYQLRDAERLVVVTRIARRDEATYRRL